MTYGFIWIDYKNRLQTNFTSRKNKYIFEYKKELRVDGLVICVYFLIRVKMYVKDFQVFVDFR